MGTDLAFWGLVVVIGISTYYVWYIGSGPKEPMSKAAAPAASPAAPEKVSVKVTNFRFEPKELTIKTGTIVEWSDERGRHTVEADDGSFASDTLTADGKFEHKFDTPGIYPYYCSFHGEKHGKDMA